MKSSKSTKANTFATNTPRGTTATPIIKQSRGVNHSIGLQPKNKENLLKKFDQSSSEVEQNNTLASSRNLGRTFEEPNTTTFSNARHDGYHIQAKIKQKEVVQYQSKYSAAPSQNKILKNFSATQKVTPQAQSLEDFKKHLQKVHQPSYSLLTTTNQSKKNPRGSTVVGSSYTQTNKNGSNSSSSSSLNLDIDEGEVDVSQLIVSKQVPRVHNKFQNIFQDIRNSIKYCHPLRESNPTLERILQDEGKQDLATNNMMLTTQACTFAKIYQTKRHFDQCQLSPTRFRDNLMKLTSKNLPTQSIADITDSSYRFGFDSRQSMCSVPDILTNSVITEHVPNLHMRQSSVISSQQHRAFPNSHLEGGPVITHNSCLHASYNDYDSSSEGSSILEGRAMSKNSCSCCQMNSNVSNTLKSQLESRFMINLETVLLQEIKLWSLNQTLTSSITFPAMKLIPLCEEWWSVTKDSACLFDLYKIYRDTHTRKTLRRAMIFECISVVLSAFFSQLSLTQDSDNQWLTPKLTLILKLSHQNLLHIICLVLQRMGNEACNQNMWAVNLKGVIAQKINKGGEPLEMEEGVRNAIMQKHNCQIVKLIKALHEKYSSSHFMLFNNIATIIQDIEKTHINRVKELLLLALNHQTMQAPHNQSTTAWQEYPLDEGEYGDALECDESIVLPAIPEDQQNNNNVLQQNLSTINEDCSYCSNSPQPVELIPPYLPPRDANRKYTLVLDLDETLIHYVETSFTSDDAAAGDDLAGQFLVRPGVHKFLREMALHYEIVIFTAAMQDYADWVLDQLDIDNCISYRLYRQHAIPGGQFFIKDLSRIGRDMSRTLIVDNVAENFQLQPNNGVFIRTWIDDPHDNALDELAPLLKEIVVKGIDDVREALRIFRIQMMEQVQRGILKPRLSLDFATLPPTHPLKATLNPEEERSALHTTPVQQKRR